MFYNLNAEMARQGISKKKAAEELGISYKGLQNKIVGKTEFTRKEMYLIRNKYFKDLTVDYLFDTKATA